jgi:hypothetical protein
MSDHTHECQRCDGEVECSWGRCYEFDGYCAGCNKKIESAWVEYQFQRAVYGVREGECG